MSVPPPPDWRGAVDGPGAGGGPGAVGGPPPSVPLTSLLPPTMAAPAGMAPAGMAPTTAPPTTTAAPPVPELAVDPTAVATPTALGVLVDEARELLGSIGRIVWRAGLPMLGIAALGLLAGFWLVELAVIASRTDAVLGILVFALVPASGFGAIYLMLGYLGRGGGTSGKASLSTLGAALLVYLVIYEQSGLLRDERREYLWTTFSEGLWNDSATATNRVPDLLSGGALGVVAVALLVRVIGGRVVQRLERPGAPPAARVANVVLRPLLGYAEIVWIVMAVLSLLTLWDRFVVWWESRVLVHAVGHWWLDLGIPSIMPVVNGVSDVVGVIVGAVVAAAVVPLVWLVLASLVYGVRFGDLSAVPAYLARVTTKAGQRIPSRRLGAASAETVNRIETSWHKLTEPEGRWDALGGALGLVLARGWIAIATYCLVFGLLSLVDRLVWWIAGATLTSLTSDDWFAVGNGIYAVLAAVVAVLAVATAAAGADVALRRAGLPSPLRPGLGPRSTVPASGATTAPVTSGFVPTASVPTAPFAAQGAGNSQ